MNLEYKITFQDDLDAEETSREYSFSRPWVRWGVIRGVAIFLVVDGLMCIFDKTDPDAIWVIPLGCLILIVGIAFPFIMQPKLAQFSLNRRAKQKEWDQKPSQQESREIIITETEFIFKTDYAETAWTWKAFKRFFEGEKCFLLGFYTGDIRYIPKRIFKTSEELNNFKTLLQNYLK